MDKNEYDLLRAEFNNGEKPTEAACFGQQCSSYGKWDENDSTCLYFCSYRFGCRACKSAIVEDSKDSLKVKKLLEGTVFAEEKLTDKQKEQRELLAHKNAVEIMMCGKADVRERMTMQDFSTTQLKAELRRRKKGRR